MTKSGFHYLYARSDKEGLQTIKISIMIYVFTLILFPLLIQLGAIPSDLFARILVYNVFIPLALPAMLFQLHIDAGKYRLSSRGIEIKYLLGHSSNFNWDDIKDIGIVFLNLDGKSRQACLALYLNDSFRFQRLGDKRSSTNHYWRHRHEVIVIGFSDERKNELLSYLPKMMVDKFSLSQYNRNIDEV